jgi:Tfp pilus assembly protein PilO
MAKKQEIEKVLNRVKEIKEKRDSILDEYNAISVEDIEKLNKIIPETINSVEIFNDLASAGAGYGLTVQEYKADEDNSNQNSVSETVSDLPYKKTKLTIKFTGPYSQFVGFLEKIESSLRIIDINSLSIKQGSSSDRGPVTLDYVLEANVYSLR